MQANEKFSIYTALQEHHTLQQDDKEKSGIIYATEHLGSCAAMYQNILESWGHFFNDRKFEARAVLPIHQFTTGERAVASFGRYALNGWDDIILWEYSAFYIVVSASRYTADDVQAADLIVSLSAATNQVVYGRYHFQVSSTGDLNIHDDQQVMVHRRATVHTGEWYLCPTAYYLNVFMKKSIFINPQPLKVLSCVTL